MSNKHLIRQPTDIILARLKILFESLNDTYQTGNMVLESDIVSLYNEAIELFFQSFDKSVTSSALNIYAGAPADPSQFNQLTNAIQKDIEAVFAEIGALDRLVSSSFNSIIAEREQVIQSSKNISNKLGDYLLYADPNLGGGYFFGDSFNTATKIEVGSSLVDTDECTVDTDEGIILLPLDGTPERPEIKSFIINNPSNGIKGSNYQLDVFGHDSIETIGDGEPNTWFEYEKVTSSESSTPLILDLTIVLKEISVINHININPINFGTASPVKITVLDTSKDGIEYVSVKDEIPLKDFIPEEEDNIFELSPSTSKNAGQGFFSFMPRKAQFIHVVFEQYTPYSIQTNNGVRLRYAIGIRDINILKRKFKKEGSLVSSPFTIDGDTRKISLWASENPTEDSTLADIKHFISRDDGSTWLQIQPQGRSGFGIPEIINFNTISEDAIITDEEVNTFRHKISMTRDTEAFSGDAVLKHEELPNLDIINIPTGGNFSVSLTEKPIKETVRVLVPYLGSFSCPRPRYGSSVADESPLMDLDFVKFNVDVPGSQTIPVSGSDPKVEGTVRYKLPFRNIPNLEHKLRVFHNGAQIEYLPKNNDAFTNPPTSHTSIDAYSKVYFLNKKGTELQFGYKDSSAIQRGFIPTAGSRIEICLDGDNPTISITDRGYVVNLTVPSDGQPENVSIVALKNLDNTEAIPYEIEIPSGSTEYRPPDVFKTMLPDSVKTYTVDSTSLGSTSPDKQPSSGVTQNESSSGTSLSSKKKQVKVSTARNASYSKKKQVKVEASKTGGPFTRVKTPAVYNAKQNIQSNPYIAKEKSDAIKSSIASDVAQNILDNQDLPTFAGAGFTDGADGMYPPVFLEGTDNFDIYEYDRGTGELITTGKQFTTKVAFKDGDSELRNSTTWVKDPTKYTFDAYSGTVYLGSAPYANRRVVVVAQKLDLIIIPQEFWRYDRDLVTNRINTQKIVLDPSVVYTIKQKTTFTVSANTENSISLLSGNDKGHSWFNKRLIKGTVKPGLSLFPEGAKPVEVPFVDGEKELNSIIKVDGETVTFTSLGSNLYTVTLQQLTSDYPNNTLVGAPTFGAIRTELSTFSPVNVFNIDGQLAAGSTPTSDGEWSVDTTGSDVVVTVYSSSTPGSHVVSYRYRNTDPGIDADGLYSVDYQNGIIYFSNSLTNSGEVKYEVSAYSAFYNLAKVIHDNDVKEVDENAQTIKFSSALGMQFLKQDTASQSRPQVFKILYNYYKTSTESLADLEPYFSPICKDIAFRAITSSTLEEL